MRAVYWHALLVWRAGVSGRTLAWIAAMTVLGLAMAVLGAAFSLRQPLVVALDLAFSACRLLMVLVAIVWTQEVYAKDLERKTIIPLLVWPCSRWAYVVGRQFGIAALLTLVALMWLPLLLTAGLLVDWGYSGSTHPLLDMRLLWVMFGFLLEALVVASFVQLMSAIAVTPMLPLLAGIGFAIGARLIGPALDYLSASGEAYPDIQTRFLPLLEVLRWILPELTRLDGRAALLYGEGTLQPALPDIAMAVGYLVLMTTLSAVAYQKREYS